MFRKLLVPIFAVSVLILSGCVPGNPPETTSTTAVESTTTSVDTTVVTPTTVATTTTVAPTTTTMPMQNGVFVNESLIPVGDPGFSSHLIRAATYSKHAGDGTAAFRTNCRLSHMNFDDPIVFPGQQRASHLHIFFGNKDTNYASTPASIKDSGNSTCWGGTANRSAYWAPAMIDTATGAPVSNSSQVDLDNFLQVYYKTGYDGVNPNTVQNFPPGLRILAGNARATAPQQDRRLGFSCNGAGGPETGRVAAIPSCAPGQLLIMTIDFPQCWDGVNLDSSDHKSHMAYGVGTGCPSSHPVPLAQITQNFRYRVPAGGTSTWRLASDMYNGPAGYSIHADWMNGWDFNVFQRVVDNCYRGGFDCSMNLLGDGDVLHGPYPW